MSPTPKKIGSVLTEAEFITEEEYQTSVASDGGAPTEELVICDWDQTMAAIASRSARTLTIPRNKDFNRQQVVQAFQSSFELIGGVPRLALWAHENESDFYKLYSKLLPNQSHTQLSGSADVVVKHVLPRGALD